MRGMIVLLVLSYLYLISAQGSYDDCCLRYVQEVNRSLKNRVDKYTLQGTDGSCNIPATVFTLRRGRQFCGDPRQKWVKRLMHKIDKSKKSLDVNKHQYRSRFKEILQGRLPQ